MDGGTGRLTFESSSPRSLMQVAELSERSNQSQGTRRTGIASNASTFLFSLIVAIAAVVCASVLFAVEIGEPLTGHWAFQPLASQSPPETQSNARVRTPVDAFILSKLKERGLDFAPDAEPLTLLRRLHLDLTGLPPTLDAIQSYLAADPDDALRALVDSLLASPHFGERWGRHWLDWAGYVDVLGADNDAGNAKVGDGKWRYRDYVVRAFNEDKPFDRFLTEQLAGDQLIDWRNATRYTAEIRDLLTATTFLRCAPDDTDEGELNTANVHHNILQQTGEIVANNLLALTVQCAKCHDHKYEPISQRDYYSYLGLFSTAINPNHWLQPKQRALPDVSAAERAEIERYNAPFDQQIDDLKNEQTEIRKPYRDRLFEQKLDKLPESIRADTRRALETPPEKRSEVQKYLAEKFGNDLEVKSKEIEELLSDDDKSAIEKLDAKIADISANRRTWGTIQAVYDTGPAPDLPILIRGETPGETVRPGFFSALGGGEVRVPDGEGNGGAQRRLQFARWLTSPNSPASALVARVYVNRLWQQLFGNGIVATSENLGVSGAAPSHPELLDWLAAEFIRNGWRTKPIIRWIVSSTVYRQSAEGQSGDGSDSDNRWLNRQSLRRLESEVIRDSMLAVSGGLVPVIGGPPLRLQNRPDGLVVIKASATKHPFEGNRRSLYVLARRNYHLSFLNTFDQPTVAMNCTRRNPSAVVGQSLTMLNDSFVLDQAERFANRVARMIPDAAARNERIELAFQLALTRRPSESELQSSLELIARHTEYYRARDVAPELAEQRALNHLCHVLFNTSEFLYAP